MVKNQRILVVGATGYLGKFIVKELKKRGYWVRALSRNNHNIEPIKQHVDEVVLGEATKPETIKGLCKGIDIGGPEILTQNDIARLAFETLKKKPKITYIPLWIKNLIVRLVRIFTSVETYGPIEFFLTVLAMDMVAPTNGQHTIKEYLKEMSKLSNA